MCKHSTELTRNTKQRQLRTRIISIPEHENILQQISSIIEGIKTRTNFTSNITNPKLAKEYLRAEIVMLVSAFDYYMSEILKLVIIQMFDESRPRTKKFMQIKVNMEKVIEVTKNAESEEWLFQTIADTYSKSNFQSLKQIDFVLYFIEPSVKKVLTDENKKGLEELFNRRHQIAHKCDIPADNTDKEDICISFVQTKIELVSNFIESLHKELEI